MVLAALRSAITGHPLLAEVAPITGPMYQLFIFFMITDPKTTVRPQWGQCLVAFLVAVVEMILRLAQIVYAPFYALFIVGPSALIVEIWWTGRSGAQIPARRRRLDSFAPVKEWLTAAQPEIDSAAGGGVRGSCCALGRRVAGRTISQKRASVPGGGGARFRRGDSQRTDAE